MPAETGTPFDNLMVREPNLVNQEKKEKKKLGQNMRRKIHKQA